ETGVLAEDEPKIVRKGRLQPGKLFLVDLAQGRIVPDAETKQAIATRRPYADWVAEEQLRLAELPAAPPPEPPVEPLRSRQLLIDNPILLDAELEQLRRVESDVFKSWTIDTTWPAADGADGLEPAIERICAEANVALAAGANILILSDRSAGPGRVPIPSLLATGAVHHHLVREGTRLQAGIVVESGEPRSVHSIAVLVGYGAAAVNPYLMLETLGELVEQGWLPPEMTPEQARYRAVKGIGKGLLKVMSKMG